MTTHYNVYFVGFGHHQSCFPAILSFPLSSRGLKLKYPTAKRTPEQSRVTGEVSNQPYTERVLIISIKHGIMESGTLNFTETEDKHASRSRRLLR